MDGTEYWAHATASAFNVLTQEAAEEAAEAEAVEAEAEEAEAEAAEEEAVELEAARACTPSGSLSMRRPSAATAHSPGASKAAGQPSRK